MKEDNDIRNLIAVIIIALFCLAASAQSDKVNEIQRDFSYAEVEWRKGVDNQLRQLQAMSVSLYKLNQDVANLNERLNSQSDIITQLKINALLDSLKIDRLEKQINYTQTFIKDSVVFVSENPKPVKVNLIDSVTSIHAAWSDNNGVYTYDSTVDNYDYIYFSLKENLKPNSTYIISFTIQLTDADALFNFWLYGDTSNQRLPDSYYKEGKHSFEVTIENEEKNRIGIRARNNNGGSFDLLDLKVVEK